MPYGNFYVGKDGFLYKKMGSIGNRRNFSLGLMCNQPTDINNKYVSGSGVFGAVSSNNYAIRRKMIRNSGNCTNRNCSINYTYMGVPLGTLPISDNIDPPTPSTSVPSSPTITSAVAGNAQVTIYFDPPTSDGGSTITSYRVTSSPGGFFATGSSSPIIVSGLTNGTSYTFTMVATNSVGNSSDSNTSDPTIPVTVPTVPLSVNATSGDQSATVTFTAPTSNGGSPITGYTVTSSLGGFFATGSSSPITVSGLTNGTSYTFTVVATNSVGSSLPSSASNSVTSGTITVQFTSVGTTSWTAPSNVTSINYLVVGGGGGGGGAYDNAGAGGGGGGMVRTGTLSVTPATPYSITVGDGGLGGTADRNLTPPEYSGEPGENSSFDTIVVALGGGFGYRSRGGYSPPSPAGPAGGGGQGVSGTTVPSSGGIGGGGGNGGGGGGGAGSGGTSNSGISGGSPGGGAISSITGSSVVYGTGGRAGSSGFNNIGELSPDNSGKGGDGAGSASVNNRSGRSGGSGIVVIQYVIV